MKKMRIAVWHNLPSGGGKRQLYNHIKGLIERGHHVEAWCPDSADQEHLPLDELVEEHIIPLDRQVEGFHHSLRPLPVVRDLLETMEQHCRTCAERINRGGFDLLFANGCRYLRSSAIGRLVELPSAIYLGEPYRWFYEAMPELPWIAPRQSLDRRPSFESLRGLFKQPEHLNGVRLQARAELEYTRGFDQILVNSAFSREAVLRTYNLESKVCYLGIDTERFQPTGDPKAGFVVGLGHIYYAKGVDRAIRAVGTIHKATRPQLVWIGDGASQHDLESYKLLARQLAVDFVPKIHIPHAEVIQLLSRATAMLYTSRLEPFGLAPLEANACGTTVVCIAEGGVRETIREGVNGYLAMDQDPGTLGELIRRLVEDPELAVEMGAKARRHVEKNWNMKMCTDNIESLLCQVCRKGARV